MNLWTALKRTVIPDDEFPKRLGRVARKHVQNHDDPGQNVRHEPIPFSGGHTLLIVEIAGDQIEEDP